MNKRHLLSFAFLAASAIAQTTVTDYVTIQSSTASSATAQNQVGQSAPTTLMTSTPSTSTVASNTASSTIMTNSSNPQATQSQPMDLPTSTAAPPYNGGTGNSGSAVDTDAGASGGTSGSFNLSRGGMIAIIVVVVIVAVFGIVSTVLFVMAKRRQWNIRQSLARASKRLTGHGGRSGGRRDGAKTDDRRPKRGDIRLNSRPREEPPQTPGHNRGLVAQVRDIEKGKAVKAKSSTQKTATWKQRILSNSWR